MTTIGLISDTHSHLPAQVMHYFKNCQEIWHAGDIGNVETLQQLQSIAPTFAVYGNIDGRALRATCPEDLWLEREGLLVFMTHIGGKPGRYTKRVTSLLQERMPDILICGHSHICKVDKGPDYPNMLYINPGAAGKQGLHQIKTIIRLSLERGKVVNLEVIELGKRGALE